MGWARKFVRGISQDGIPQALFAAVVCVFSLAAAYIGAKLAATTLAPQLAFMQVRKRSRRPWALRRRN